jgi:hypothetical protein
MTDDSAITWHRCRKVYPYKGRRLIIRTDEPGVWWACVEKEEHDQLSAATERDARQLIIWRTELRLHEALLHRYRDGFREVITLLMTCRLFIPDNRLTPLKNKIEALLRSKL